MEQLSNFMLPRYSFLVFLLNEMVYKCIMLNLYKSFLVRILNEAVHTHLVNTLLFDKVYGKLEILDTQQNRTS
jgi:hypothetical protein